MFNEKNLQDHWRQIVERSWANEEFKQAVIEDPRKVLAEAGIELPAGLDVTVVENRANHIHLVLPPKPGQVEALPAVGAEGISIYNPAIW